MTVRIALVNTLTVCGFLSSCAQYAKVIETRPKFGPARTTLSALGKEEKEIADGLKLSKRDPLMAMGDYLAAAQAASQQLTRTPNDTAARDDYTETKKVQEAIVVATGIPQVILRPTLMFGWFDRKHVGWLARFMERVPVFPVPGTGRFLRQPLYAADFCNVIVAAIEQRITGAYNITGQERIDYIDLVRAMKRATSAKALIVRIPYSLFALLLRTYALVDSNPPFTEKQLAALVTPDVFEVIDWPGIFGVKATPLQTALDETFRHPVYSKIALQF